MEDTREKETRMRDEMAKRWSVFEHQVVMELSKKGHQVDYAQRGPFNQSRVLSAVDGQKVYMEFKPETKSGRGMYRNYTGRIRYTVTNASYDKSTSYPEPKSGLNVEKAIEHIKEAIAKNAARNAAREESDRHEVERKATFNRAMELIGEGDREHYGSHYHKLTTIRASSAEKVKVECYVTPEKLARLMALINE